MTTKNNSYALERFQSLSSLLEDCIASNEIVNALSIAEERHQILVDIIEDGAFLQKDKKIVAQEALLSLSKEKRLSKSHATKQRGDFIVRKTAYHAYTNCAM